MALLINNKYLFLHLYKCGGTTIRSLFKDTEEIGAPHDGVRELFSKGVDLNKYHTFTFIRNPYDWMVSLYEFIRKAEEHPNYNEVKDMLFDEFVDWHIKGIKEGRMNGDNPFHGIHDFITDINGKKRIDFVGQLETIHENLETLFSIMDMPMPEIPVLNTSTRDDDYRKYYSEYSKKAVEENFNPKKYGYGY